MTNSRVNIIQKRITIKVDKDLHYQLKVLAAQQELSLETVMNRAAKMYLQENCKDS